jgi:protein required for attachment to host cells
MVDPCCVIVADGSRARVLTLEEELTPTADPSPCLIEQRDLLNPEADAKERDLWSDKSGRGREIGAHAHGYDDHRAAHADEFKRRFAARVVEEVRALVHARGSDRVIVAAERQMLGFLRPALAHALEHDVEICEVAKDLSRLSAAELQERLAGENLVPHRRIDHAG